MHRELEKEILINRLIAHSAIGAGGDNKSWVAGLSQTWNKYVIMAYGGDGLQVEDSLSETDMLQEWEKYRHIKLSMTKTKERGLVVSGLGLKPRMTPVVKDKEVRKV